MAKKILIVDDDPGVVQYLSELLGNNGYATTAAMNGQEALAQLESQAFDMITLDIEMPDVSGPKFNRIISKGGKFDHIPIIVITGYMGLKYVIPKAVATLDKPFDEALLLKEVKKALGEAVTA